MCKECALAAPSRPLLLLRVQQQSLGRCERDSQRGECLPFCLPPSTVELAGRAISHPLAAPIKLRNTPAPCGPTNWVHSYCEPPNVGVDRAAHHHSTFAAPGL